MRNEVFKGKEKPCFLVNFFNFNYINFFVVAATRVAFTYVKNRKLSKPEIYLNLQEPLRKVYILNDSKSLK
jgi:hypothetical protein